MSKDDEIGLEGGSGGEKQPKGLMEYLRSAVSWNKDRRTLQEESERLAWFVTKFMMAFTLLALIIIWYQFVILHNKGEKVVVLVADKSTGNIERMESLEEARVNLDESFVIHFVNAFMLAREGYNPTKNEENYYIAGSLLCPKLQNDWYELWKPDNPNSPIKKYGQDTIKKVDISSIIPNHNDDGTVNSVTARYSTTIIKSGVPEAPEYRIASIGYSFTDVPRPERERRINPAGFSICAYQTDPELAGARSTQMQAAPQPATPQAK